MASINILGNLRRNRGNSAVERAWGNIEIQISNLKKKSEYEIQEVYNNEIQISNLKKKSEYEIQEVYNNEIQLSEYNKVVEG